MVTNESYESGMAVKEAVHGVPLETLGGDVQLRSETNSEGSLERLLVNVPLSWGACSWLPRLLATCTEHEVLQHNKGVLAATKASSASPWS